MTTPCITLAQLIYGAYVTFAGGHFNGLVYPVPMEQLPSWTDSDSGRYQIEAKAEGTPGQYVMHGPMLQALLEDRFALKIHMENREGLTWSLTVAKGGIRMQPFKGSCTPVDSEKPLEPLREGDCRPFEQRNGSNVTTDDIVNMDAFVYCLARATGLGAPVINKTSLTGYFHVHMEYESTLKPSDRGYKSPTDDPPYPSLFTAVEKQLGLKLEATTGPRRILIVDHVERPSGN
jgi:uncharacterized protein (TIGR03435 family)